MTPDARVGPPHGARMGQLLGTLIRHAGATPIAVACLPIAVIGTGFGALLVRAPSPLEGCASR